MLHPRNRMMIQIAPMKLTGWLIYLSHALKWKVNRGAKSKIYNDTPGGT